MSWKEPIISVKTRFHKLLIVWSQVSRQEVFFQENFKLVIDVIFLLFCLCFSHLQIKIHSFYALERKSWNREERLICIR